MRLRLLNLLASGEVCVCHLYEALGSATIDGFPSSGVSQERGLVVGRKEGLWVHYRLAKPSVSCIGH